MLANAIGGAIYESLGPPALFAGSAAVGFLAAGLGWLVLPRIGEVRPPEAGEPVATAAAPAV